MRRLAAGAAMAVGLAATLPARAADCLAYESPVTLVGYYGSAIFPGPPNFESVADGDAPEEAALLFLSAPICVDADPSGIGEAQAAVWVVQLACAGEAVGRFAAEAGSPVTISGTLFGAHTGHHHLPVLLACE